MYSKKKKKIKIYLKYRYLVGLKTLTFYILDKESVKSFSVISISTTHENKTFLLELKESLLIMKDKPSLDRNITLAPLYLFDRA